MMTEAEIMSKMQHIFDVCLSSGIVKTVGDAAALCSLYKDLETSLSELHSYRNSAEQSVSVGLKAAT